MTEQDFSSKSPDPIKPAPLSLDANNRGANDEEAASSIIRQPRQRSTLQTIKNIPKFSLDDQSTAYPKQKNETESEVVPDTVIMNQVEEPIIIKRFAITEKISLIVFCCIFLLGAFFYYNHFFNVIPTRPIIPAKDVFPKNGQRLDITSVDTFWRKPIDTGDDRDPVKLGTLLIPSIKLGVKPRRDCGILIIFRNGEGKVMGDQISRSVRSESELKIAASSGLFELGMFNEIGLNEDLIWTVEILEAPSVDASIDDFVSVYKGKIKTEQR